LDNLKIDDSELSSKEKLLNKNLLTLDNYTLFNQAYNIISIAEKNNVNIQTIQRQKDEITDDTINKLSDYID
jgi:hypothetical protein